MFRIGSGSSSRIFDAGAGDCWKFFFHVRDAVEVGVEKSLDSRLRLGLERTLRILWAPRCVLKMVKTLQKTLPSLAIGMANRWRKAGGKNFCVDSCHFLKTLTVVGGLYGAPIVADLRANPYSIWRPPGAAVAVATHGRS
jgi:hypothetical protein